MALWSLMLVDVLLVYDWVYFATFCCCTVVGYVLLCSVPHPTHRHDLHVLSCTPASSHRARLLHACAAGDPAIAPAGQGRATRAMGMRAPEPGWAAGRAPTSPAALWLQHRL